jgi:general secretion pathway protein G
VKGKIRKDHNLHPLNSEFDLYSMGADGASVSPLTAKASRDDVIWGRDGSFVGLASDF